VGAAAPTSIPSRVSRGDPPAVIGAALLLLAAVLLVAGAELFVDNLAGAARRLRLPVLAVAVLLAGAEPEELVTAVLAAAQGRPGLAVGDAIGANVTMLTAALGLAALVRPLPVGPRVRRYAVGAALAGGLALLALAGRPVTRLEGGLLLTAYAGLVALVWWRERTPPAIGELADGGRDDDRPAAFALALAVAGLVVMTAGGAAAVDGAERLVRALGRSDAEIGLTVLALATTAELFALVLAAARRGVHEVAVAAVVGSAAYNATATLGAAALVQPLPPAGVRGAALLAAALPLAVLALAPRGRLGRLAGGGLLATYTVFVVLTLG
jgi:cation:H+ antiporter